MPEDRKHGRFERLLVQSFEAPNSLGPDAHAALREHIRGCERCQAGHARLSALERALDAGPRTLSTGQLARGLAALPSAPARRPGRRATAIAAAGAVAAAGLLLVLPSAETGGGTGAPASAQEEFAPRSAGEAGVDPAFRLRVLRIRDGGVADAETAALRPGDAYAVMASAPPGLRSVELLIQTEAGIERHEAPAASQGFEDRRLLLATVDHEAQRPARVELRFHGEDGGVVTRRVTLE